MRDSRNQASDSARTRKSVPEAEAGFGSDALGLNDDLPFHIGMIAADIVERAGRLGDNPPAPPWTDDDVPLLVGRRCRVSDDVLVLPYDLVADMRPHLRGFVCDCL